MRGRVVGGVTRAVAAQVCWAPDVGRSYELLASASRDRIVRIWKVYLDEPAPPASASAAGAAAKPRAEGFDAASTTASCCCELPHDGQVWRAEFNACGSMLAVAVDDGTVHVYKMDASGTWVPVQRQVSQRWNHQP